MTVFRFALSILLVFSTASRAAMVMPPPMETPADYQKFAEYLRKTMPSLITQQDRVGKDLTVWAQLIDNLADTLLKDAEFNRLAAERPDPISFTFYSYTESKLSANSVSPDFVARLSEYFQTQYLSLADQGDEQFLEALNSRIRALADAIAAQPSMGLMAGLGMVFPADQRREILSRKNFEERAQSLLTALEKISEENLREVFQSERFGVPRTELTKSKAAEMIQQAVAREQELTMAISLLQVFENGNLRDIDPEDVNWFTGDDASSIDTGLPQNVIERLRAQAKNTYSLQETETIVQRPITRIFVKEMPAHLAVFRGCSGGDCSTSASWSYPFSPTERYYYVYEEENTVTELGYVSGAITDVDGVPTFYLRDMSGFRLAPEHIDLIVEGFAKVLPELGVKQMTFAHEKFVNEQGHFPPLQQRINLLGKNMETVSQSFRDVRLRTRILNQVVSDSSYDAPRKHVRVRLYDADKKYSDLPMIGARVLSAEEAASGSSGTPDENLQILLAAFISNKYATIKRLIPKFADWREMYSDFKNKDKVTLAKYWQRAQRHLKKLKIPLSRKTLALAPGLFFEGQLNASNAFRGENAEKIFATIVENYMLKREESILHKSGSHKRDFMKSRAFESMVQEILTKKRAIDNFRILELWSYGYRFDLAMDEDQAKFLMSALSASPYRFGQFGALEIAERLIALGQADQISRDFANYISAYFYYSPYSTQSSPYALRALKVMAQVHTRSSTVSARLNTVFRNQRYSPPKRFAAALGILWSRLGTPRLQAAAYEYVSTTLDQKDITEDLRTRAREVLGSLSEVEIADYRSRAALMRTNNPGLIYLNECGIRATRL